ncbi:MAG: hybrid sensor histidine kinase/response regulator [Thermoflexales bacterium]|nr:hybrid sensor histidine kinase/response regulator [Thermoflexales bacterium]
MNQELDFSKYTILIVDDNPTNLAVLSDSLRAHGFKIVVARDGEKGFERAVYKQPDLILLDVMMPGVDGFETCARLKAEAQTRDIPVIFMTALANTESKVEGFGAGAVDYITKPFQQEEVLARLTTHLRIRDLTRQLQLFNEQLERTVCERTEELRKAYEALDRVDKTKSDFIDVAAHELRTPLSVVMGFTQVLGGQLEGSRPEIKSTLDSILGGAVRLHEIVNAMLDVARIDAEAITLCKEMVRFSDVFHLVVGTLQAAMQERHISLATAGLDELPAIEADPGLLQKAFYNLVVNAIKYTPDGGALRVSGQLVRDEGDWVQVAVSDSGIGIDPAHHGQIFEKFYQTGQVAFHSSGKTKFKGGGPGLGLTIARGIVRAHGGKIWVESPGCDEQNCPGSTFYVRLPFEPEVKL